MKEKLKRFKVYLEKKLNLDGTKKKGFQCCKKILVGFNEIDIQNNCDKYYPLWNVISIKRMETKE